MEKDNEQESTNNLQHIDYKNVTAIEAHLNPHARMMSRRRTRMSAKGQRDFARAVKRARFMALVPYISH